MMKISAIFRKKKIPHFTTRKIKIYVAAWRNTRQVRPIK